MSSSLEVKHYRNAIRHQHQLTSKQVDHINDIYARILWSLQVRDLGKGEPDASLDWLPGSWQTEAPQDFVDGIKRLLHRRFVNDTLLALLCLLLLPIGLIGPWIDDGEHRDHKDFRSLSYRPDLRVHTAVSLHLLGESLAAWIGGDKRPFRHRATIRLWERRQVEVTHVRACKILATKPIREPGLWIQLFSGLRKLSLRLHDSMLLKSEHVELEQEWAQHDVDLHSNSDACQAAGQRPPSVVGSQDATDDDPPASLSSASSSSAVSSPVVPTTPRSSSTLLSAPVSPEADETKDVDSQNGDLASPVVSPPSSLHSSPPSSRATSRPTSAADAYDSVTPAGIPAFHLSHNEAPYYTPPTPLPADFLNILNNDNLGCPLAADAPPSSVPTYYPKYRASMPLPEEPKSRLPSVLEEIIPTPDAPGYHENRGLSRRCSIDEGVSGFEELKRPAFKQSWTAPGTIWHEGLIVTASRSPGVTCRYADGWTEFEFHSSGQKAFQDDKAACSV